MLPPSAPAPGVIEWYGPDMGAASRGNPLPDQVEYKVSHHADTVKDVHDAADRLALSAEFILSAHHKTGDAEIGVYHQPDQGLSLDSIVYMKATDEGWQSPAQAARAVTAIEFGWTAEDGTEVPGIGALQYAIKHAVKTRRMAL